MNLDNYFNKPLARGLAALALTGVAAIYSATSIAATAAHVYSATIGTDIDSAAAPGQTVYLPYVLSNTGNGTDTYSVTAVDDVASAADTLNADSIAVYLDTNGNGQPDANESIVTTVTLNEGEVANLVVAVQVPTVASSGDTLAMTLTAQAQEGTGAAVVGSVTDLTTAKGRDGLDDTNESVITISGDAVLVTTKSAIVDAAS